MEKHFSEDSITLVSGVDEQTLGSCSDKENCLPNSSGTHELLNKLIFVCDLMVCGAHTLQGPKAKPAESASHSAFNA